MTALTTMAARKRIWNTLPYWGTLITLLFLTLDAIARPGGGNSFGGGGSSGGGGSFGGGGGSGDVHGAIIYLHIRAPQNG